jgi:succinate-semialdehyde dehydrogenase/glutarate-semialdehyde dehydrogenase
VPSTSQAVHPPIVSVNPATGEEIERFHETSDADLATALAGSARAFAAWRDVPFAVRADRMREAARLLRSGADTYARTMALEMGKPVRQGRAEVEKCAWTCDFYAENAGKFLAEEPRPTDARESYVRYEPLGPVLAIMPWNFPFWQVFRFAAPALMAGNTALLKHASNVTRSALEIERIFRDAGFPESAFRTLVVGSPRVGSIIADPRVQAVTLTGSDAAGSKVGEQAGRAVKKLVLELGGSDPFIVLEDADIPKTAKAAADARLINSGQSCIAAKRFIVMDQVADRFVGLFVDAMRQAKMGDPLDEDVDVGPQARIDLRDGLHQQVERSLAGGAKLLLGGRIPGGPGAFYPPTVLEVRDLDAPALCEETFGPVAAVVRVRSREEAVEAANRSIYGLGASVWTTGDARPIVARIEAGTVFVNAMVKSDPRLPFGGIKRSGYGRELSELGIREFVNIKSVWIE